MGQWSRLLLALAIGYAGYYGYTKAFGFKKYPVGVYVESEPIQGKPDYSQHWKLHGFEVESLATYDIKCRLLQRTDYSTQCVAKLSPMDFTVTWGIASNQVIVDKVTLVPAGDRFAAFMLSPDFPLDSETFIAHMANMHIIPEDDVTLKMLRHVREGEFVRMTGYLVKVKMADGSYWKSSLVRTDTDQGACEIMLVKNVEVLDKSDLRYPSKTSS